MDVAVAVITDKYNRVLLTRRSMDKIHGGLWEFPGGKLEQGESSESALLREVNEEVGLEVNDYNYLGTVAYSYPQHTVNLIVFHVTQFTGKPRRCESQMDLQWIDYQLVESFKFPDANSDILKMLKSIQKPIFQDVNTLENL